MKSSVARGLRFDPRQSLERVINRALGMEEQEQTCEIVGVYYVVGLDTEARGASCVQLAPSFHYVVDAGQPSYACVNVPFEIRGAGDPAFPNFNQAEVFGILEPEEKEIVSPFVLGCLLIIPRTGISVAKLQQAVVAYGRSVLCCRADGVEVDVNPLHEKPDAEELLKALKPYAKDYELQRLTRRPVTAGWHARRVL